MISILKSAFNANSKEMGIISNNIANANSNAFKKSKANFEHIYSTNRSTDPNKFSGVGVTDPLLQMSQGSLNKWSFRPSYRTRFSVVHKENLETPFFTRDGSFNLNVDGEVVTNDGLNVMGYLGDDIATVQNLIIPTQIINEDDSISLITNINVDNKGKIFATYGLDNEVEIGNFVLASFVNETGLRQVGNNRYQTTTKSGLPAFNLPMEGAYGKIQSGNLERSNVDITSEMVTMLKTQQAFSGVSRLLQTEVDIAKRLIDG